MLNPINTNKIIIPTKVIPMEQMAAPQEYYWGEIKIEKGENK